MPHIEILKDGNLIRRQAVPREKAVAGCGVRLGAHTKVTLKLGESTTVGGYDVRIIDDTDAPMDSQASVVQPVPRLDGYEIQKPLGEGGMGMVWRGIQLSTNRPVAIKFLSARAFNSERSQRRFKREVELSAKLEHPNIARIYDSGLRHGAYYYAMELVEGVPLDEYVKGHALDQKAILRLMKTVCEAVQHAHQRGVIHRDLKPSNIIVDANGEPHVVDFGLAKSLMVDEGEKQLSISIDGDVSGTPAYMSPEQAAGRVDEIDNRADVYSLGVILYRLLVGHPPVELSGSRYEVMRRIVEQEMRSPKQLGVSINADLEGLLRKCLARVPAERYADAGPIAADIENYLEGRPLAARKATPLYLMSKRVARNRAAFAMSGLACAAAIFMAVGLLPGGWVRRWLAPAPIVIVEKAGAASVAGRPPASLPVETTGSRTAGAAVQPAGSPSSDSASHVNSVPVVDITRSSDAPARPLHLRNDWDNTLRSAIDRLRGRDDDGGTAAFLSKILDSLNQPGGQAPEALAADLEKMKTRVRDLIAHGWMQSAATLNYAEIYTFISYDFPNQPPNPHSKTGGSAGPDGLVLYLPLDKPAEGNVVHDQSGAGNDGHVYGAQWVSDAEFGGAYRFRIANFTDRIVVPNSDTLNPSHITVSAWIKTAQALRFWRRICDKDFYHGYDLALSGDIAPRGTPWFETSRGSVATDGDPLQDNQWYQVAGTFDGQTVCVYLDGHLKSRAVRNPGPLRPTGWDLCIGNSVVDYGWGEMLAFDGLIAQVRIYNRALSGAEIMALRNLDSDAARAASAAGGGGPK